MEILAGELPKIFALDSRWLSYLRNLKSNITYLFTIVGAAVSIQGLRALGAFQGLVTAIVRRKCTPAEWSLRRKQRTGDKRPTPGNRFLSVGLPPKLVKAVSVLDSRDGPSGAKTGVTTHIRGRTRVS